MKINNYQQIYLDKTIELAQTIVIKSEDSAEAVNQDLIIELQDNTVIDRNDPTSWRYYMNLAGEYHPFDTPMTVVSMDTRQEIIFNKPNLQIHRTTALTYAYGTRHYRELVARYPKQEQLILGILNPVDINEAIAAKDGTILMIPPGLVEENEYSLKTKLQDWIYGFKKRWTHAQFSLSDDLYSATWHGIMYLNLVPTILNLRLAACKTNEAHSFHVWQYLASHGFLSDYKDFLTLRQALFFYRNINYIERNAGKSYIFKWLVQHIMTERLLPLDEFVLRHDVSKMPGELTPEPVFKRNPMSAITTTLAGQIVDLDTILQKEDKLAPGNLTYRQEHGEQISSKLKNSLSSVVATKVLESVAIDDSNSTSFKLEDVLLNHWLYLSSTGQYSAYVNVLNPKTTETFPLTAKEAFIFMWYAFSKSIGITLQFIPLVLASRVYLQSPKASVDDLMEVVDHSLVERSEAQAIVDAMPNLGQIVSIPTFYDRVYLVHQQMLAQRKLWSSQNHHVRRGMVKNMATRLYADIACELEPGGTTYASWFAQRNIKIADFTDAELTAMYKSIVLQATGADLHPTTSLAQIQLAMIKMLSQLSSYSIHIMQDINTDPITQVDNIALRVGDIKGMESQQFYIPDTTIEVVSSSHERKQKITLGLQIPEVNEILSVHESQKLSLDMNVFTSTKIKVEQSIPVLMSAVRLGVVTATSENSEGIPPILGLETFLALSEEQRRSLKDIYNRRDQVIPAALPPLSSATPDTDLDGLDYNNNGV